VLWDRFISRRSLRRIHATLKERGDDALLAGDLKDAVKDRVFGFEIMPAPFVVSHLQLGLLLDQLGAPLAGTERAGVYLTNALTGWAPPKGAKKQLMFSEFNEERDAAEKVKRDPRILVVIGNPPYNAFAGVSTTREETDLIAPYKNGLAKEWGIKKFNLDDLYVRFFRLAEHRIADMTGRGIVCFISNFSYLSDPSFVVMRTRFLDEFNKLWFDCLNGDSRETGKLTPEGDPDPSVFSTERNPEGIRVGTTIGLLSRDATTKGSPQVKFRQFWGATKRADLLDSLSAPTFDGQYQNCEPVAENRFSFRPSDVTSSYRQWPKISDLCRLPPLNGLMEKRDGALIDIDRDALQARMITYYDSKTDWATLSAVPFGLTKNAARFDAQKARKKVLAAEQFEPGRVVNYMVRPFDTRWSYYSGTRPLWNEPRPRLWEQIWKGNSFLLTRPGGVASPEGIPVFFTRALGDNDCLRGHAYYIPVRLRLEAAEPLDTNFGQTNLLIEPPPVESSVSVGNLSDTAVLYLDTISCLAGKPSGDRAETLFMHVLAIGCCPKYRQENPDGVQQDWPRVPLPAVASHLIDSAELGTHLAGLLDPETTVRGVTTGRVRNELGALAVVSRVGHGSLSGSELQLNAGWSHKNRDGAIMPGKGKTNGRDYSKAEREAISKGAENLGLSSDQVFTILGAQTLDVYLNDVAYWSNVPEKVWEYTIGGYQVIKKWLSYREEKLLGRPLTKEEVRYVQEMVRRIAAILLLTPALDANYQFIKAHSYPWPPK
jgi:hypothetical protein